MHVPGGDDSVSLVCGLAGDSKGCADCAPRATKGKYPMGLGADLVLDTVTLP